MAMQMATATNAHYFAIGCRFGQGLDPERFVLRTTVGAME